ncbi:hypothetical protein IE81DRAFT_343469 [Ceraceosorus guamensis]|uniref:Uncharacterized protein n=1 Tax=Ceraceosorus guamensis TaxID=1522189 RepID=A0A316VQA3_9BASI|nr:hypothetical protein IE81DRAFT_343469 [Ceraceosorus guamensis]PWN39248.1 hypothetical protein IE81DRAFT_343469 [Ceraceosorus guamensis]
MIVPPFKQRLSGSALAVLVVLLLASLVSATGIFQSCQLNGLKDIKKCPPGTVFAKDSAELQSAIDGKAPVVMLVYDAAKPEAFYGRQIEVKRSVRIISTFVFNNDTKEAKETFDISRSLLAAEAKGAANAGSAVLSIVGNGIEVLIDDLIIVNQADQLGRKSAQPCPAVYVGPGASVHFTNARILGIHSAVVCDGRCVLGTGAVIGWTNLLAGSGLIQAHRTEFRALANGAILAAPQGHLAGAVSLISPYFTMQLDEKVKPIAGSSYLAAPGDELAVVTIDGGTFMAPIWSSKLWLAKGAGSFEPIKTVFTAQGLEGEYFNAKEVDTKLDSTSRISKDYLHAATTRDSFFKEDDWTPRLEPGVPDADWDSPTFKWHYKGLSIAENGDPDDPAGEGSPAAGGGSKEEERKKSNDSGGDSPAGSGGSSASAGSKEEENKKSNDSGGASPVASGGSSADSGNKEEENKKSSDSGTASPAGSGGSSAGSGSKEEENKKSNDSGTASPTGSGGSSAGSGSKEEEKKKMQKQKRSRMPDLL